MKRCEQNAGKADELHGKSKSASQMHPKVMELIDLMDSVLGYLFSQSLSTDLKMTLLCIGCYTIFQLWDIYNWTGAWSCLRWPWFPWQLHW